jgi:hypothetical protein
MAEGSLPAYTNMPLRNSLDDDTVSLHVRVVVERNHFATLL